MRTFSEQLIPDLLLSHKKLDIWIQLLEKTLKNNFFSVRSLISNLKT